MDIGMIVGNTRRRVVSAASRGCERSSRSIEAAAVRARARQGACETARAAIRINLSDSADYSDSAFD
jgi:hypothetical protein